MAAESFRAAQQAAQLATWEIEEQPPIAELDTAIDQDTTVLPSRDWGLRDLQVAGDNILRGVQHIGGQEHFYLEGQAAIALPQDDGGVLVSVVHSASG